VRSAEPLAADARGDIVPGGILAERYELVRLLAEGGMGEVWEAKHLLTRRRVAAKVLQSTLSALPDMRHRLLREARAATALEHPNVVNVYDVFELEDGSPVMVMAFLSGETLGCRLEREGMLPLGDLADVLVPVISAVGFAHSRGIVHRDLKPENVFLASDGGVKVLDFGIAKLMNPDEHDARALTRTGMVIGTPGYMAPEQCFGESDIDHQADVWAIGAIAYEALSGYPAVSASTFGQALKQFASKTTVPIALRAPELPSEIASLVDRMIAVERHERPIDLREAYEAFLRHACVGAPAFGAPVPRVSQLPEEPAVSGTVPVAKASAPRAIAEEARAIKVAR
jgi:serine/threonine protein kinase